MDYSVDLALGKERENFELTGFLQSLALGRLPILPLSTWAEQS